MPALFTPGLIQPGRRIIELLDEVSLFVCALFGLHVVFVMTSRMAKRKRPLTPTGTDSPTVSVTSEESFASG